MSRFPHSPDPLDVAVPLGDGTATDSVSAHCPYCGEACELVVDPGGGGEQEYVEDCPVCCRPWRVTVHWSGGVASVRLETEDE